jgi:hypothetical protein
MYEVIDVEPLQVDKPRKQMYPVQMPLIYSNVLFRAKWH